MRREGRRAGRSGRYSGRRLPRRTPRVRIFLRAGTFRFNLKRFSRLQRATSAAVVHSGTLRATSGWREASRHRYRISDAIVCA